MKIGIPRETKNNENRVGLTPNGVNVLVDEGHEVLVETQAGIGSQFTDKDYKDAGATLVNNAAEAWDAELVIKVKEPQEDEYQYLTEGLVLFTYLHLANEPELAKVLIDHKVTAIGYETVQLDDGSLPLLTPMSEIAGRMSTQIGAQFLQSFYGGKGILLGGVPGVQKGRVTIIGGGVSGTEAAKIAIGLRADVTILDLDPKRLKTLSEMFGNNVQTLVSNKVNIAKSVKNSDLIIGAVLIPGAATPKLVTEEMIKDMDDGGVIIDIAIDQGGVFETTDRITTHDKPTYTKHGIVHYAVANIPGAVPRTSTMALSNVTLPYIKALAKKGAQQACADDAALAKGINTMQGHMTYEAVAEALDYEYKAVDSLIG
ncbi:alanine dehydrogenase [Psychrobacter sp. F1192]|uniref:Alanine dehydrogenase n=1 Tax=Psychrobacter coccoides TaxID=2818440 RepID=A0ABS3NLJ8_9GAMM|nr:alanine dehydrogenase [Psychrobacter coccoides]MBO1530275.1 alanine dehydrogenase [Psychrobacter coccoides]